MLEPRNLIPVAEALAKVMRFARPGGVETVRLDESYGRILAEDIRTDADVPAFDRSAFDGYAVRACDTAAASTEEPAVFEVTEDIPAGTVVSKPLGPGQAMRIMTGAPLPAGGDAVTMLESVEETERGGKRTITLTRSLKPGENVSSRGEEAKAGEVLIAKGGIIHPGTMALLASLGCHQVKVARKPVAGVITTGSELLEVDEPLRPGMIRNSNATMVCAQLLRSGALSRYYGKIKDDFESTLKAVRTMLEECDIVITTGGVAVGDYDHMPLVYRELGANILFDKIGMRPGSVTTVAELDGKLLFGLSGNPSACFVGFELFARPVIRTVLQSAKPHLTHTRAVLAEAFPKANPFTRFVRAKTEVRGGRLVAAPAGFDKSSAVITLPKANSLIVLPSGTRGFESGAEVDVLLLDDQEGAAEAWTET